MLERVVPSKSVSWYRGMAQHVLLWAVATTFFLFDDRVETSIRVTLSLALGLTCLAAFFAALAVSAKGSKDGWTGRRLYFAAAVPLLGLLALHGAYLRSVGGLHVEAIEAILQTDLSEAFGYFATHLLLPWAAMWGVSVLLLWLTFPIAHESWTRRRSVQVSLLVGGLVFIVLGRGVVTEPIQVVKSYREGINELRQAALWRQSHPLPPIASGFQGTVILVIGESTSRHHMSIYGYPRETTPALSALGGELAIFQDSISGRSSTVGALLDALTLRAPGQDPRREKHLVGILELAKAAGFETTWLSNQNEFGVWDSPVRILAQQADRVRYHDPSLGKLSSRRVFDEAMLPSLDQALARTGPRKLVVMHLMSTHLPYCWTKPPDFNPLRDEFGRRLYGRMANLLPRLKLFARRRGGDLDCYDNGVRYVDRLLGAVVERAKRLPGPATVLYFSDHGEAPLLATGHDGAEHSAYHLEIPFVLWANPAYRAAYPQAWSAAMANRSKPFSLTNMAPTLAGLLALRTPLARSDDSLFEPAYRPRPRTALDGQIRYDARWKHNDYRENSRVFVRELGAARAGVWAHRVNSLGALLEAKRTFAGVEVDVRFDEARRVFKVQHFPTPDIGLGLREWLEWSRDRPRMKIWLDWKNATPQNVRAALAELAALDRAYGLKGRTLVETGPDAVSPALALISKAGFRHGYYLPTGRIQAAMRKGGPAMDALAREVERVVLRGRFDAITYDASLHPFVRATLDTFLTRHKIRRYSWDSSIDSGHADSDPAVAATMLRERRLEGLLIKFPSDFWI